MPRNRPKRSGLSGPTTGLGASPNPGTSIATTAATTVSRIPPIETKAAFSTRLLTLIQRYTGAIFVMADINWSTAPNGGGNGNIMNCTANIRFYAAGQLLRVEATAPNEDLAMSHALDQANVFLAQYTRQQKVA